MMVCVWGGEERCSAGIFACAAGTNAGKIACMGGGGRMEASLFPKVSSRMLMLLSVGRHVSVRGTGGGLWQVVGSWARRVGGRW